MGFIYGLFTLPDKNSDPNPATNINPKKMGSVAIGDLRPDTESVPREHAPHHTM